MPARTLYSNYSKLKNLSYNISSKNCCLYRPQAMPASDRNWLEDWWCTIIAPCWRDPALYLLSVKATVSSNICCLNLPRPCSKPPFKFNDKTLFIWTSNSYMHTVESSQTLQSFMSWRSFAHPNGEAQSQTLSSAENEKFTLFAQLVVETRTKSITVLLGSDAALPQRYPQFSARTSFPNTLFYPSFLL